MSIYTSAPCEPSSSKISDWSLTSHSKYQLLASLLSDTMGSEAEKSIVDRQSWRATGNVSESQSEAIREDESCAELSEAVDSVNEPKMPRK